MVGVSPTISQEKTMPANHTVNHAKSGRRASTNSSRLSKPAQRGKALPAVGKDEDKLYDPEWDTASDEDDLNTYVDIAQKDD